MFSFLAVFAFAGLFMLASCKSDKKEEVEETVEVEVETPTETEAPSTEAQPTPGPRGRLENQLPPEIAIPCEGKNAGDDCTVTISEGQEIGGSCRMTKIEKLACLPKARPGKTSTQPNTPPSQAQ